MWQLNEETRSRNVQILDKDMMNTKEQYFFNWDLENKESSLKGGFHSLIGEGYLAAVKANIGIDYGSVQDKIEVWSNEKKQGLCMRKRRSG
jgi:hypothetical protein